jgi:hypothetical protein
LHNVPVYIAWFIILYLGSYLLIPLSWAFNSYSIANIRSLGRQLVLAYKLCCLYVCHFYTTLVYTLASSSSEYLDHLCLYLSYMEWLRYQREISLKIQIENTNQRNKWANTDPRIYRRWDQVPKRSKHSPVDQSHPP